MQFVEAETSSLSDAKTLAELRNSGKKIILFFWAAWHDPSKPGGTLQESFSLLAKKHSPSGVKFLLLEAEAVPEVSEAFGVSVVPTFIALSGMTEVGKLEGVNPAELVKLVKKLSDSPIQAPVDTEALLKQRLVSLINAAPVMLFMKGLPGAPRCGFSRQIVEILQAEKISFRAFDILTDEEVRAGLKKLSDWPTYPQLYVNGSFVGGLDILKEMREGGPLKEQLGIIDAVVPPKEELTLTQRLKALTTQAPVMLFMKGLPNAPRCGFSRQIVDILKEENVEFEGFDILTDEDVRNGLKEFSDWPTFPQLYVNGSFVGGLDIVREMREGGGLKEQLGIA